MKAIRISSRSLIQFPIIALLMLGLVGCGGGDGAQEPPSPPYSNAYIDSGYMLLPNPICRSHDDVGIIPDCKLGLAGNVFDEYFGRSCRAAPISPSDGAINVDVTWENTYEVLTPDLLLSPYSIRGNAYVQWHRILDTNCFRAYWKADDIPLAFGENRIIFTATGASGQAAKIGYIIECWSDLKPDIICSGGSYFPLDTTVDYDIAAALFGTAGVSRTLKGDGIASDGRRWTIDQVFTTRVTPDPTGPCLAGETQQDEVLTLTSDTGDVITSAGPSCYSTSGLIQNRFELDVTDSSESYSMLTIAGTLPLTARITAGGLSGTWSRFEDLYGNGDDTKYNGGPGEYIGSSTSNWKLEDQRGRAALVFSAVLRDENGTQEGSETDTYFITPSGTITGFKIKISRPGLSLTLTGTAS